MKRAFTLIELLVIIAIMGLMVTVGIVSVRSGQGAARVKGATRDIFAAIRHARSTALVTQQPAVVRYATEEVDGEVVAKVEITSAKLMSEGVDRSKIRTVTGAPLKSAEEDVPPEASPGKGIEGSGAEGEKKGETLEDVLFAPIDLSIVKGMRIKVIVGDGELEAVADEVQKSKISVFSNVDYLLGRFKESKKTAESEKKVTNTHTPQAVEPEMIQIAGTKTWNDGNDADGTRPERVTINLYADGKRPEDGLCIKIDRFGAAKVISGDGREED